MIRLISTHRMLVLSVVALGIMVCFTPRRALADSIVTQGGTTYDITTVIGSFSDLSATLEAQPWWGDATLAENLAALVGCDFGCPGPDFAYFADPPAGLAYEMKYPPPANPTLVGFNSTTIPYRFAIAAEVSTPEPGTITLLFVGLLGLVLLAGVKRYRRAVVHIRA